MTKPSSPSTKVLLVEGDDEVQIFRQLFEHYHISEGDISLHDCNGLDGLKKTLRVQLKKVEMERIGVVVDADVNLSSRWDALRYRLIEAGYTTVPALPAMEGTIIREQGKAAVGIWLMPDNQLLGMLEDFLIGLIPQGDLLLNRAEACLNNIPTDQRLFSDSHHKKALVHTWLAWQKIPGTPLRLAITRRCLDPDAPKAEKFMEWLRRLFDLTK